MYAKNIKYIINSSALMRIHLSEKEMEIKTIELHDGVDLLLTLKHWKWQPDQVARSQLIWSLKFFIRLIH